MRRGGRSVWFAVPASAVRDGRGDPAVLLVRLHQTLEGGFGFLATEGLFRFPGLSTDPPLRDRKREMRLEPPEGSCSPPLWRKRAASGIADGRIAVRQGQEGTLTALVQDRGRSPVAGEGWTWDRYAAAVFTNLLIVDAEMYPLPCMLSPRHILAQLPSLPPGRTFNYNFKFLFRDSGDLSLRTGDYSSLATHAF